MFEHHPPDHPDYPGEEVRAMAECERCRAAFEQRELSRAWLKQLTPPQRDAVLKGLNGTRSPRYCPKCESRDLSRGSAPDDNRRMIENPDWLYG